MSNWCLHICASHLLRKSIRTNNTNSLRNFSRNMSSTSKKIGVLQLNSSSDKEKNFKVIKKYVEEAAANKVKMVFLPESCDYIGETRKQTVEFAESLNGNYVKCLQRLAEENSVWISVGSIHLKGDSPSKIKNTGLLLNNLGEICSMYAKTHMYDVDLPEENIRLIESSFCEEGTSIPPPVTTPCGNVGLAICYDMRFPEVAQIQRRNGAHVLTFPSAFTVPTGRAHWHSLLRARAIENQCYVVAAALTGKHNPKRESYGHSIVIDPWGEVVAELENDVGLLYANIDLQMINDVRRKMPVFSHKRNDLYTTIDLSGKPRLNFTQ